MIHESAQNIGSASGIVRQDLGRGSTFISCPWQLYQADTNFKYTTKDSLKHTDKSQGNICYETDAVFVQSVKELCWQRFGALKKEGQLTDEQCEQIHQDELKIQKELIIDRPDLICKDIMNVQFLSYDGAFFFFMLKIFFIGALLMSIFFSIPAMVVYGRGSRYLTQPKFNCSSGVCLFSDRFSMYNMENGMNDLGLLEWLGFGGVTLLMVVFYVSWVVHKEMRAVIKYQERIVENSVLLRGLPEGKYGEGDIMELIARKYGEESGGDRQGIAEIKFVLKTEGKLDNPFGIKAIQIVYDIKEAREMVDEIIKRTKDVHELMKSDEKDRSKVVISDHEKYLSQKGKIIEVYEKLREWRRKFIFDEEFRKTKALDSAFIHLSNNQDRQKLQKFMQKFCAIRWAITWGSFQSQTRRTDIPQPQLQHLPILDQYELKVGRIPDPQNVQWDRVEHTFDDYMQNHAGFKFMMVVLPFLYFGMILLLEFIKVQFLEGTEVIDTVLSFAITVGIVVSGEILMILLDLSVEKQQMRTKSALDVYKNFAGFGGNALGIILAPLIVNYAIKDRFYGNKALVGSVFSYQFTSLLTLVLLNIIGIPQLLKKIMLGINCIRNKLIRSTYGKGEGDRMSALEDLYRQPQFEISYTYAFITANMLHCITYGMLCPVIIIFFTGQVFLLYWCSKIRIFVFCTFPQLIHKQLIGIIMTAMLVSPFFFVGGFLVCEHAYDQKIQQLGRVPIGLFVTVGVTLLVIFFAGVFDKKLEGRRFFQCLYPSQIISSVEELEKSRRKRYPSKSSSTYIGNNLIKLFGFEKYLLNSVRNRRAEQFLETFCQTGVNASANSLEAKLGEIQEV